MTMTGYLARPARAEASLPGVVVVQEAWGVDGHIQDVAQRFATAGYVALAPDLFAVNGRRPEALTAERVEAAKSFMDTLPPGAWGNPTARDLALAALPEAQRIEVAATMGAIFGTLMDPARSAQAFADWTSRLQAAVAYLRGHASSGHKVGAIGFCMGGALSGLLACSEPALSAAAVFYGSPPPEEKVAACHCPIVGLYGGEDTRITSAVPAFAEAMRKAGKPFESHVYPGVPHAFFNDTRVSFRVDAARDAWSRTLAFFARELA